jgi:hypothetical protein
LKSKSDRLLEWTIKKQKIFQNQKSRAELYRRKNTIQDIEKSAWNQYMGKQNIFDWDGMVYLEKTFSQHQTNQQMGFLLLYH